MFSPTGVMDPKDVDNKKQTQGIRRPFGVAGKFCLWKFMVCDSYLSLSCIIRKFTFDILLFLEVIEVGK